MANFCIRKLDDEAESAYKNGWRISAWESFIIELRVQLVTSGESLHEKVSG